MLTLTGIRAVPSQNFNTEIEQGTIFFNLYFRKTIEMWVTDLTFNDFSLNSIRLCNHYNLLDHYTNLIPFGLMVSVNGNKGYEPSLIDDFTSNRVTLNVLDQEEVLQIETVMGGLVE
jgi:hypothetical protein